ncbi:hypothetical protein, partial [Streptomyces sp. NPDC005890]|uniref:hypothetical protein n=1 Tax=Streptomyces sp. NPDC005890 TaxID=3154568 RepID=UPI0033E273F7
SRNLSLCFGLPLVVEQVGDRCATDAFVAGLTRTAWVAAVVVVAGAVAVWRGLPRLPAVPAAPRSERCAAQSSAP